MAGAIEGDTFIGNSAQEYRGLLKIKYPMEHGIVTDWDDMEKIWQHVYSNELKISSEEHPLLLTEAPLNPRSNRSMCAQIFFETFNVPAMYVSIQAVLALYASGKTTGVVLDSGDGVTHTVPVYGGFSINSAIQRIDVAGRSVTYDLQRQLRKSGIVLQSSAELELVRNIKEKLCYIASDAKKEEKKWLGFDYQRRLRHLTSSTVAQSSTAAPLASTSSANALGTVFRLPDGKDIILGPELFRAPEILFSPDLIGSEANGVHQLLADSISRCDIDLRSALYESIVLSGGSTLTKRLGDRLLNELKTLVSANTKLKIFAPPERKYSTWVGGSILGGLSTFKKMWVSSDEWHENPDIIHVKCM